MESIASFPNQNNQKMSFWLTIGESLDKLENIWNNKFSDIDFWSWSERPR